jgi:hypothetical protein
MTAAARSESEDTPPVDDSSVSRQKKSDFPRPHCSTCGAEMKLRTMTPMETPSASDAKAEWLFQCAVCSDSLLIVTP